MNKEAAQEFIKSLENFLEKIIKRQDVSYFASSDVDSDQYRMDIADPASSDCHREFIHSIQQRNYKLIREISALLRRIKDGSFGICNECFGSIDIGRLRDQPGAALCINCQKAREAENRTRLH